MSIELFGFPEAISERGQAGSEKEELQKREGF
jgi:hypothetical protein